MFPTLSEAVTGNRLTVGPPFYTTWMLPIGLILLTLTGVGPLLAWRRSTVSNLLHQFTWPVVLAAATMGGLYAAGFRVWVSGLCFGLCAFVCGTISQEFVRGAFVRREATGTGFFTALVGLVARSRRRYGGHIVHVGIVLMFLGFAGSGYKLDSQVLLRPGQETEIGRYTVRYDRLTENSDARKQMITAHMTVLVDGETVDQLYPARWFFFKHESEPTTEVAMRRTVAEDLYVVLAGYEMSDQAASFQIHRQPAGQLDLVRVHGAGARHRSRLAAGERIRLCGGHRAAGGGDRVHAAVGGRAHPPGARGGVSPSRISCRAPSKKPTRRPRSSSTCAARWSACATAPAAGRSSWRSACVSRRSGCVERSEAWSPRG